MTKRKCYVTGPRATHGESAKTSQLYRAWVNMRQRCNNPKCSVYHNYGGRGISACTSWNTYEQFKLDVGQPPSKQHTLDRINNGGNYEPGNVRWATRKEQMHNVRINVYITHNGECLTLTDWARRCGVTPSTMHQRIRTWGAEKAVSVFKLH
jgi:hypothetical protein